MRVKQLVSIAFEDSDEIFVDAVDKVEMERKQTAVARPVAIARPVKLEGQPKKLTKEEKQKKLIDGRFKAQNWAWKEHKRSERENKNKSELVDRSIWHHSERKKQMYLVDSQESIETKRVKVREIVKLDSEKD